MKPTIAVEIGNVTTALRASHGDVPEIAFSPGSFERRSRITAKNGEIRWSGPKATREFTCEGSEIYTGWTAYSCNLLRQKGYAVSVVDGRRRSDLTQPVLCVPTPVGIEPRPYQSDAVAAALTATRGIIALATAGGKTVIAAMIMRELAVRSLFMVPSESLLHQAAATFRRWFGEDAVGLVGAGSMELGRPVTVATQQTLWSRIKDGDLEVLAAISEVEALFIDECHHVSAELEEDTNTWFSVAKMFVNAYWRFGMTATPGPPNTLGRRILEAATGRVIVDVPVSLLTEKGWVSPVDVVMIRTPLRASLKGQWHAAYGHNILRNEARNQAIVDVAAALIDDGQTVLIVCNRVEEHGNVLFELLKARWGDSLVRFIWGGSSSKERAEALAGLRDRTVRCIVGTIFNEGIDIPSLDCIINAGAGKSEQVLMQRIGRVLRLAPGKERGLMIDFTDEDKVGIKIAGTQKMTVLPEAGMLARHARSRMHTYKSEGHTLWYVDSAADLLAGGSVSLAKAQPIKKIRPVGITVHDVATDSTILEPRSSPVLRQ